VPHLRDLVLKHSHTIFTLLAYYTCAQETVLIGDTPDDIAAVIAAGGRGIGVRTPLDQAHVSYYNHSCQHLVSRNHNYIIY
jgi:phosphoglycolate phosphatase-like HAD superfamily hydrolase